MKSLIALFSAKKLKVSMSNLSFEVIGTDDLRKIRGGGHPANREDINILIAD